MVDSTATGTPPVQKKTLPVECLKRLQKFDEALTALEVAIAPILQVSFDDHMKRSALGLVRVDVMTMFVMNSLGWCLAALRGLDPKDDVQLGDELRRTKQYVERLKSIETRKSAPGLNKRVAKVGIRQERVMGRYPVNAQEEDLPEGSNTGESDKTFCMIKDSDNEEDIEHNSVSDNDDYERDDEMEPAMPPVAEEPTYTVANVKFEDSDNEEDIEHNSVSDNDDYERDDEMEPAMPPVAEEPTYTVANVKFEDEVPQRPARVKTGRRK
ncbi:hypothetical protein COOONC_07959 [Cooperia oncophora]